MRRPVGSRMRAIGALLALAPGSCAAYGEQVTTQKAQAMCAKKGGTFKKDSFENTTLHWVLSGTCEIPDQPLAPAATAAAAAPKKL